MSYISDGHHGRTAERVYNDTRTCITSPFLLHIETTLVGRAVVNHECMPALQTCLLLCPFNFIYSPLSFHLFLFLFTSLRVQSPKLWLLVSSWSSFALFLTSSETSTSTAPLQTKHSSTLYLTDHQPTPSARG